VLVEVLDEDFEISIQLVGGEAGLRPLAPFVAGTDGCRLTIDTAGFLLPFRAFLLVFLIFSRGANSSACSKYSYSSFSKDTVRLDMLVRYLIEAPDTCEEHTMAEFEHVVTHLLQ
jgi:hypothetical protein